MSTLVQLLLAATIVLGCSPRVKVEAPDKPIEINVNVKIEQEVKIKLDKAIERTLEENPELFGAETKP
ncbi:MAG: YnbE family lipoprotein [Candidatus Thiosymbion ectosymbiont of Robbea hypermnestra]|nr:YnbE family lipoprotein [Candidatus Thiosymbion ectosymbiont of Robbea hypermnestra]